MIIHHNSKLDLISSYINFSKVGRNGKSAIIPNIQFITRELTTRSQTSLIIHRLKKIGFYNSFKLAKNNIFILKEILNKDFAVGIKLLCELEIIYSPKKNYILHNQIVDMAVALQNKKLINYYFHLSKVYRFNPAVITYNLGPFINFLAQFNNIPENLVIFTPIKKSNCQMSPWYEDLYEFLCKSHLKFKNFH